MKKKMYQSVVATHFREHSSIYLFVVVLFLMGVIFGAIVVNSLTFSSKGRFSLLFITVFW